MMVPMEQEVHKETRDHKDFGEHMEQEEMLVTQVHKDGGVLKV